MCWTAVFLENDQKPATLPVKTDWHAVQRRNDDALASEVATLGYPGLSHLEARRKTNSAEVVLSALGKEDLDTRLAEALPWVLLERPDLNWQWLIRAAKVNDLQNKFGFETNVSATTAEKLGKDDTAKLLCDPESSLEDRDWRVKRPYVTLP